METEVNNHISSHNLQQQLNDYAGHCPISVREPLATYSRFGAGHEKTGSAFDWMLLDKAPEGIVKKFVLKAQNRNRAKIERATTLAYTLYSRGFKITLVETDWRKDYEQILQTYPMLELLQSSDLNEKHANAVYDYVRLIDNRTN